MIATPYTGPAIELRRLHRFFGNTRAVDDVSFTVPRGSVFGFIGPNGAGKTTSMRVLATLELPTYGDALVDGFSSINDPERVRRQLGFMPDSFGTYAYTSCEEYLDFFARAYGLVGRQRSQRMRWVMDFTGLKPLAEKPVRGLSKGMRQRLCLGRALIHDPNVLILDEPAAGLDPRARIELRKMIRALAADGKTLLVSSHILTELAEMCDRVGIIEQGRLLATGTVDEIRQNQRPTRELEIRVLDNAELVGALLENHAEVSHITCDGNLFRFSLSGDETQQATLLRTLVIEGATILEFSPRSRSLEDVFLQVTQGLVQ